MKIIVQKFGGTSVKDEKSRGKALTHIRKALQDDYKVVVVVSAMGRKGDPYATDTLLQLVQTEYSSGREQDLLLSCGEIISSIVFSNMLNANGIKAIALTGAQAGFRTNEEHTNAKIIEMKCDRILEELNTYDVVVVAGFQGVSRTGEVTTLGRGGSDTSAVAIGAALMAEYVDIFTDVEGVMTADPRIVQGARPLSVMTYTEICNLAHQGAKVIHPRAVEIAMQAKIALRIRSTYSDHSGTLVTSTIEKKSIDIYDRVVTGIAHVPSVTQITIQLLKGQHNSHSKIFKAMANEGISVDFINISPNTIVYTVMDAMTDRAIRVLRHLGFDPKVIRNCAKVSAVGAGMTGVPGVTARIVNALSNEGINILQSADSHTTIWVLVHGEDMNRAVNALHDEFLLEDEHIKKQMNTNV